MAGSITTLVLTEIPIFALLVGPILIGILFFYTFGYFLNLEIKNRFFKNIFLRLLDNKIVAEIALEGKNKENFYQIILLLSAAILFLSIPILIPEYGEIARVEFDNSKIYFKNVYWAMIIKPTPYSDVLEVSTEHGPNSTKKIVISTLAGDLISSHIMNEKTIEQVQTKILSELRLKGVQPFSKER